MEPPGEPSSRRTSRRRLLVAAAAGALGVAAGRAVADTYAFGVELTGVRLPRLEDALRVAFLCDLHFGPYIHRDSVARWVDACLETRADLILLGGDMVDKMHVGGTCALVSELGRLRAPLGVFAVWGNHDHARFARLGPFAQALRDAGIDILTNTGLPVRDDLFLAGIDDFRDGRPDLASALRNRPAAGACLLVSHNPDALPDVPPAVDLTLCGHTHGGQIRLPVLGAVVTSSRHGRRFAAGWVRGPALGYVSRGLGFSLLPLRLDCPAELTVLDLRP